MLGVVLFNSLLVLAGLGESTGGPRRRGALVLAVGEPVTALAAGDAVVVAATDLGDVLLLDSEGTVRRRLPVGAARAPTGRRARRDGLGNGRERSYGTTVADAFLIGAGVPADDDFNDPYDVDSEVEDPTNVLRGDGSPERRAGRAGSGEADSVVVLAAGGHTAWFARSDGLLRALIDESTPPERLGGSSAEPWSALAASHDGRWLAGVRGGWLVRSEDGGETFDSIGPVAGPVARLAVTDQGDILLVDGHGAHRVGGPTPETASAWPGALDACVSGGSAVVLAERALVIAQPPVRPSGPGGEAGRSASNLRALTTQGRKEAERLPLPEDVDRLACDGRGGSWAIGGSSLWTSPDAGRSWSRRWELPPIPAEALAVAGGAAWVATSEGLWRVPLERHGDASPKGSRAPSPRPPSGGRSFAGENEATSAPAPPGVGASAPFIDLSLDGRRPPWWAGALPRVDLDFTWATGGGRREVRAFVLLSFAIERDSGRALLHRRLMRQVLRRRNELEGAAAAFSAASLAASDPIDAEERVALAHVLEVTHE